MDNGFVIIKKETLQQLLDNFYEACNLADEMDIYEWEEGDEGMQEMKDWAKKQFGRTIDRDNYE
jgi:hypothetical protein